MPCEVTHRSPEIYPIPPSIATTRRVAIKKSVRNFVVVYQSTTTPHPNMSSLGQWLQLCYYYHLLRLDRRFHYHCSQCKIGANRSVCTDLTLRIRILLVYFKTEIDRINRRYCCLTLPPQRCQAAGDNVGNHDQVGRGSFSECLTSGLADHTQKGEKEEAMCVV